MRNDVKICVVKRSTAQARNPLTFRFVSESLVSDSDRRFAQLSWRYMNLYRAGLTGKLVEYGAKRYKSHRCIPKNVA